MANQQESNQYYSYSKLEKFRCCEKKFRIVQALLLLFMVICFIFYIITFGIDVAKFLENIPLLIAALTIVLIAMLFLVIGIRGVAFESFWMVLTFSIVFFFVTIAHGVSFIFRHPGLTALNFILSLLLFLGAIIYLYFLIRMNRLKPSDYDVSAEARSEDTESSMALTSEQQVDFDSKRGFGSGMEKIIVGVKSGFSDLNHGISENIEREYGRTKQELDNIKSDINGEVENVKRELNNLQTGIGENMEKEFVAVKHVLLNETQKDLDAIKDECVNIKTGIIDAQRDLNETVKHKYENVKSGLEEIHKEYITVKRTINDDAYRTLDDIKGRYGDMEKELGGSFKSGLGDIEKEFNIFQKEFGGGGDVQKVVQNVRKGLEEFKSGGENVKREIVEVKRDEAGNITSYIERRFTDSGVEISSVTVDKGRAPIANFTS